jgi:hypothetical protein
LRAKNRGAFRRLASRHEKSSQARMKSPASARILTWDGIGRSDVVIETHVEIQRDGRDEQLDARDNFVILVRLRDLSKIRSFRVEWWRLGEKYEREIDGANRVEQSQTSPSHPWCASHFIVLGRESLERNRSTVRQTESKRRSIWKFERGMQISSDIFRFSRRGELANNELNWVYEESSGILVITNYESRGIQKLEHSLEKYWKKTPEKRSRRV